MLEEIFREICIDEVICTLEYIFLSLVFRSFAQIVASDWEIFLSISLSFFFFFFYKPANDCFEEKEVGEKEK